jgi:glycosyltransferase involved in cell wall biosynthesis
MLQPHLGGEVDYITVGSRNDDEHGTRRIFRIARDYLSFYRRLNGTRYDLVHLNPSLNQKAVLRDGLLIQMAKSRGCKVLVFIHGWNHAYETTVREKYLRLFQKIYFQADAFIVLASEFKDKLRNMGCNKPIFLATTAVEDDIFALQKAPPDPQRFRILFLSRVEKEKGIYEALDTLQILRSRHPETTLAVAGDGTELAGARSYAARQGITGVEFCGYLSGQRKYEVLRTADLFLFPTYSEGMPISLLEAMACGIPAVTRPVGGLKDFFQDGRMGFSSETKDPTVFAELIERLMADREKSREIGLFNRAYAQEHFSLPRVAGRIAEIHALCCNPA